MAGRLSSGLLLLCRDSFQAHKAHDVTEVRWIDFNNGVPAGPGWYAVNFSWDIEEGVFVGASRWEGAKWDDDRPHVASTSSTTFATKREAEVWARANDRRS